MLNGHSTSSDPLPPPQYNGTAKRRHKHIVDTGLTLLHQAKVPLKYWSYAFQTVIYLINRLLTLILNFPTPHAKLFNKQPNYNKLKVFYCLCFPWLKPYTSNKLEPKSSPCLFLGYSLNRSANLCMDIQSRKIYNSHHVCFLENEFPLSTPSSSDSSIFYHTWFPSTFSLSDHVPMLMTMHQPLV